ncbi:hypothetical protein ACHAWF_018810 [Thalassiosira exigua]
MDNFELAYCLAQRRHNRWRAPNFTPRQFKLLYFFRHNDNLTTVDTDKNTTAANVMPRPAYSRKSFNEHLSNKRNYKHISKAMALRLQHQLRYRLWTSMSLQALPKHERLFLICAVKCFPDKLARFRMTAKAHKCPSKCAPSSAA